jgi:tetratricopeptide (TPR) repeat protein
MKRILIFCTVLIFSISLSLSAQKPGGGGGGGTGGGTTGGSRPSNNTNNPSIPRPTNPNLDTDMNPRIFYILGKVVTSDGSPLSDRASIQSNCRGNVKTEGYTDAKGNFSFEFDNSQGGNRFSEVGPASDSSTSIAMPNQMQRGNGRNPRDCDLQAVLPGFTSQIVDLGTKSYDFGHLDVGRIVVRRMGTVEGATISAKPVPENARKDYFKGLEEKQKGKLDSAKEKFQKAVNEYPEYAAAWVELGRVQNSQNDPTSAKQSFHQSVTADSTYLPAYQELAQIAAKEKSWQDLADATDQMVRLDPSGHPEFWYYNCVAKYYLGKTDEAQNSVTQGIRVDPGHRIPKMEYVLGIILMRKGDRAGAAEHLKQYLAIAPNGPDAADAQKQLQEVEKASTETPVAKP